MDSLTILPTSDAPQRLCGEIMETLRSAPGVQNIMLFGSQASGCGDAFSDVDMLIECDDPNSDAWEASQAIRNTKDVLYYRMFSSSPQPSGRYWFADESPLTRLDISFHTKEECSEYINSSQRLGYPLQTRIIGHGSSKTASKNVKTGLLEISDSETFFGERIYRISRSVKHALRAKPFKYSLGDCIAWLTEAMEQTSPDIIAGGDGHRLARRWLQLARLAEAKKV